MTSSRAPGNSYGRTSADRSRWRVRTPAPRSRGCALGQRCDVLVGDHHGLAVVGFVRLGDVAILHDLTAHLTDALVKRIRPLSLACTWWNFRSWSSVALYTLTGTFTRPNAIEAFQMERISPVCPARGPVSRLSVREGQHGRRRGSQRKVLRLVGGTGPRGRTMGKVERKDRGRRWDLRGRRRECHQRLQCAACSLLRLRRAFARISHLARVQPEPGPAGSAEAVGAAATAVIPGRRQRVGPLAQASSGNTLGW